MKGVVPPDLGLVCAVVIHHNSLATVAGTVAALVGEGVLTSNLLVVDNSERPGDRPALEAGLPDGVEVVYETNRGYAAAINVAIDHFRAQHDRWEFFLVATHEVRTRAGAVPELVRALKDTDDAAVAGPTLVTTDEASGETVVWSAGGYLSRWLQLPAHHSHRGRPEDLRATGPQARDWVDGAFVVYRWPDIRDNRPDEAFFLYMEETELHLRLRSRGRGTIWVPSAVVWQSSGGVPPFYFARNLRLLYKRRAATARSAAIPLVLARRAAADIIKRRDLTSVGPLLRGYVDRPLPGRQVSHEVPYVAVVNPLGGALAHYAAELSDTLGAGGVRSEIFSTDEPSASSKSRLRWVRDYLSLLLSARSSVRAQRSSARVIVTWPVLGYLDLLVLRVVTGRASIVIHDPDPLVGAVGYGRTSRRLATAFARRVGVIAHSSQAQDVLADHLPRFRSELLPHPMLERVRADRADHVRPAIRVLGQYKRDRDVEALERIAQQIGADARLEIVGRGWPDVQGWTVDARFVPEAELDHLIADAQVVVIPYRRFFQSGIALRCLEQSTLVVGPSGTSLDDLLGTGSPLLVDTDEPDGWTRAIRRGLDMDDSYAEGLAARWRSRAVADWSRWADG
ncbi:glycosyltransferase [Aeromicrobium endophyticum]|uniref:Glycosyltransferase n=1 Tax=Aeromicrobium endophyticum TaxID=2292704 RepID=A0A371PAS8_9ACTN|nr:glycosyltransferase [Aeromicrobium endophyticum]REK73011.1 glycosyltransferase [Aeromicrobium endophyticum]